MTPSSCSLSSDGRAAQLARYGALAPSVRGVARDERSLSVEFASDVDRAVLDELVAVERECCPFLEISVGASRLTIAVTSAEDAAMLDVFAEALAAPAAPSEVA